MSRYKDRIADGLCARCGDEPLVTKTMGEFCRQKALKYAAKRRAAVLAKQGSVSRFLVWLYTKFRVAV